MDGILNQLSASRGLLQGELARLAHGLEWVISGIDLASIAIMLVGGQSTETLRRQGCSRARCREDAVPSALRDEAMDATNGMSGCSAHGRMRRRCGGARRAGARARAGWALTGRNGCNGCARRRRRSG